MSKTVLTLSLTSALALAACMTPYEEQQLGGALVGGAVGLIGAKALGASDKWVIVSTLAGAAVGTLVAENRQTGECAYAVGDGTYRVARCP